MPVSARGALFRHSETRDSSGSWQVGEGEDGPLIPDQEFPRVRSSTYCSVAWQWAGSEPVDDIAILDGVETWPTV